MNFNCCSQKSYPVLVPYQTALAPPSQTENRWIFQIIKRNLTISAGGRRRCAAVALHMATRGLSGRDVSAVCGHPHTIPAYRNSERKWERSLQKIGRKSEILPQAPQTRGQLSRLAPIRSRCQKTIDKEAMDIGCGVSVIAMTQDYGHFPESMACLSFVFLVGLREAFRPDR